LFEVNDIHFSINEILICWCRSQIFLIIYIYTRIILKWMFKKCGKTAWTRLNWHRRVTVNTVMKPSGLLERVEFLVQLSNPRTPYNAPWLDVRDFSLCDSTIYSRPLLIRWVDGWIEIDR
jgi:hypothetical protein